LLSSILSTASNTSSVIGMYDTLGVSEISKVTVICLLGLVSAFEILSASEKWNMQLATLLNLAITPMVLTFFLIIIYMASEVMGL
jgi:hypothetical protein